MKLAKKAKNTEKLTQETYQKISREFRFKVHRETYKKNEISKENKKMPKTNPRNLPENFQRVQVQSS